MRTRSVYCVYNRNKIIEDNYCDLNKPISQEKCNTQECPYWSASEWSECSLPCNHQSKHNRSVTCIQNGKQVEDSLCPHNLKPAEVESCEPSECPIWKTTPWSACSASCGKGIQTRVVYCEIERSSPNRLKNKFDTNDYYNKYKFLYHGFNNERVDDSKCDLKSKPINYTECSVPRQCPEWRTTEWSACKAKCGTSVKYRGVYCSSSSSNCPADTKPSNVEVCVLPPCVYSWRVGNWSEVRIDLEYIFSCFGLFPNNHANCHITL